MKLYYIHDSSTTGSSYAVVFEPAVGCQDRGYSASFREYTSRDVKDGQFNVVEYHHTAMREKTQQIVQKSGIGGVREVIDIISSEIALEVAHLAKAHRELFQVKQSLMQAKEKPHNYQNELINYSSFIQENDKNKQELEAVLNVIRNAHFEPSLK